MKDMLHVQNVLRMIQGFQRVQKIAEKPDQTPGEIMY